jgi:hypothetical protein
VLKVEAGIGPARDIPDNPKDCAIPIRAIEAWRTRSTASADKLASHKRPMYS